MKYKLIRLLGTLMMFTLTIVMVMTFFTAYFHQDKVVTIYINKFGEANIEAVFMMVAVIFGTFNLLSDVWGTVK